MALMARLKLCLLTLGLAGLVIPAHAADEIHWTITAQTSVAFDWRGPENSIRYGLTSSYGQVVTATTPNPLPFSSAGPFWEARITGLRENTLYHYSIGSSPDHTFRTPQPRGVSDFVVYAEGDIGDSADWWRVTDIQNMIGAGRPHFVLAVGDLTYGNSVGQDAVDTHFNDVMVWSREAAYMPAWGNHEWDSPGGDDLRNYKGRFDLPNPQTSPGAPSPGGTGEDWSWFDYGNVRFISYPEPYDWSQTWDDWYLRAKTFMDQAQNDPAITFIVTFGHQPAYSSGYHAGEPDLANYMGQLGATHSKYMLNLNGHSHNYERSHPQSGVTHLTVGVGGADLEQNSGGCLWPGGCPPPSWSAFRAMHHAAVELRFTSTAILGTVYCGPPGDSGNLNDITCTVGSIMDSFVIGTQPVSDLIPPAAVTDLR